MLARVMITRVVFVVALTPLSRTQPSPPDAWVATITHSQQLTELATLPVEAPLSKFVFETPSN